MRKIRETSLDWIMMIIPFPFSLLCLFSVLEGFITQSSYYIWSVPFSILSFCLPLFSPQKVPHIHSYPIIIIIIIIISLTNEWELEIFGLLNLPYLAQHDVLQFHLFKTCYGQDRTKNLMLCRLIHTLATVIHKKIVPNRNQHCKQMIHLK
jgi:hypothetical protein